MNSELTSYPLGAFLLGVVGMAYWYYKLFHASGGGDLPQRVGRYWRPKNFDSVIVPSYSMWMILGPVVGWFGQYDPPKWLFFCPSNFPIVCTRNGNTLSGTGFSMTREKSTAKHGRAIKQTSSNRCERCRHLLRASSVKTMPPWQELAGHVPYSPRHVSTRLG